ncbi:unnamed protein product, partial [Protopolystoma xenopodis]
MKRGGGCCVKRVAVSLPYSFVYTTTQQSVEQNNSRLVCGEANRQLPLHGGRKDTLQPLVQSPFGAHDNSTQQHKLRSLTTVSYDAIRSGRRLISLPARGQHRKGCHSLVETDKAIKRIKKPNFSSPPSRLHNSETSQARLGQACGPEPIQSVSTGSLNMRLVPMSHTTVGPIGASVPNTFATRIGPYPLPMLPH